MRRADRLKYCVRAGKAVWSDHPSFVHALRNDGVLNRHCFNLVRAGGYLQVHQGGKNRDPHGAAGCWHGAVGKHPPTPAHFALFRRQENVPKTLFL